MSQNKYPLTPREKVLVAFSFLLPWGSYLYFYFAFSPGNDFQGLIYKAVEKFNLLIFVAPLFIYMTLKASKYLKANSTVSEIVIGIFLIAAVAVGAFGSVYIRLKM